MAVETDPGTKPTKQAAAPAVDHEAEARRAREELAAERKRNEEEKQQLAAALQDPEVVKNLAARVGVGGTSTTPDADEGDDGTLVDRRELRKQLDAIERKAANVIVETSAQSARQIRAAHLRAKRAEDPKFKKYEGEVVRLLDQMNPSQSADPDTIEKVYSVVRSNHLQDEEAEYRSEIRKQEIERLRARGIDVPDDEDEDAEEPEEEHDEPVRTREPGRSSRPAGAMRSSAAPSSMGSSTRNMARTRAANTRQLSRDEKMAVQIFNGIVPGGLNEEEFVRYGDKNWKPDLIGSKGRNRF